MSPTDPTTLVKVINSLYESFKEGKYDFARIEYYIFRLVFFLAVSVSVARLVTMEVSGLRIDINLEGVKTYLPVLMFSAISLIALLSIITFIVLILKGRTAEVSHIKESVRRAYSIALDQSPFNPHRLEEKHEQTSSKTT
jgi:hypothetical protein